MDSVSLMRFKQEFDEIMASEVPDVLKMSDLKELYQRSKDSVVSEAEGGFDFD